MSDNIQQLQEELAELVARYSDCEGTQRTKIQMMRLTN